MMSALFDRHRQRERPIKHEEEISDSLEAFRRGKQTVFHSPVRTLPLAYGAWDRSRFWCGQLAVVMSWLRSIVVAALSTILVIGVQIPLLTRYSWSGNGYQLDWGVEGSP